MKIKVLHLISGGEQGGSKTHVISLVKELQKQIQVSLALLLEGDFFRECMRRDIPVRVFSRQKRYNPGVVAELCRILKKGGYNLLHCHGPRANFTAFLSRAFHKVPVVTTLHSDYQRDFENDTYKNILYTALHAASLKRFDRYVVVSQDLKEILISKGFPPEKIHVVYNGIDFRSPVKRIERQEYFRKLGIAVPENAKVIGILARLHPIKGHPAFLEGARRIVDMKPNTHFLIAGDGGEKDRLLALRSKLNLDGCLHFLGHVKSPDEFFQAVDINVLTSLSEGFPFSLLEGARAMKPTVSTAVGGIPDLIIDGETGFLIQPGNSRELSEKVLALMDNENSSSMGKNLYEHARKNFSVEKLAEGHLKIYADLICKTRRGSP